MNKILREKIQEALSSVLPITLIVLVLSMTITPMPVGTLVLFLAGAVLLIVGMAFFSLGTDVSMTPMGEGIGAQLPKTKNLAVVIAITLLIGILITIAEPVFVARRTGSVHLEQHADLDGRSRRRSVLRARTAAHNLQNTAFSSAHSILYCSFHLFRLCAERICIGCIRFGRCYDRPDHGSVHHGARRWSRFDTRRQRRSG